MSVCQPSHQLPSVHPFHYLSDSLNCLTGSLSPSYSLSHTHSLSLSLPLPFSHSFPLSPFLYHPPPITPYSPAHNSHSLTLSHPLPPYHQPPTGHPPSLRACACVRPCVCLRARARARVCVLEQAGLKVKGPKTVSYFLNFVL